MVDAVQKVEAVASTVAADAKADVAKVETVVKADAAKVEAVAVSTWSQKVKPWLAHAASVVAGYVAAHFSVVSVVAALVKKVL